MLRLSFRKAGPNCETHSMLESASLAPATKTEQRLWDGRAGSFGAVHIAVDRKTGVRRAVKTMVKRFGPGGALESNFVRRVQHEVNNGG